MIGDANVNTAFGIVVRERREELRISQDALADKSGFDRTYISGIERGRRNPSLQTIERLAKALDLNLDEAFGRVVRAQYGRSGSS